MSETIEKYCPSWNDKLRPMLEDAEKLGAAAERARIRVAVEGMRKEMDYCNANPVFWLDKVLSLLKDGDGE